MFGQFIDKIDSYFGRAFLLARFGPWLIALLGNFGVACVEFPAVRAFAVETYQQLDAGKEVVALVSTLLAVWLITYVTAPIVPIVTKVLEGEWLPAWLAACLVVDHAQRRERVIRRYRALFLRRARLPSTDEVLDRMSAARREGAALREIRLPGLIKAAEQEIGLLRAERWLNRLVSQERLEAAVEALSVALRGNCAEVRLLHNRKDIAESEVLDALHVEMAEILVPYVTDVVEQREWRALDEQQRLFAKSELAPTSLGNDAASLRSYCTTRYGIEFDFFWPRYLLLAQKDPKTQEPTAIAKIQLDFSMLSLALTTLSTVGWMVVMTFWGRSLWTALLVLGGGPLAMKLWLEIVHASHSDFAELVRSSVDLRRFEVLSAMRYPLPATTELERQAWQRASRPVQLDEPVENMPFQRPAT